MTATSRSITARSSWLSRTLNPNRGLPSSTMTAVEGQGVPAILRAIRQQAADSAMVMGMGNIATPGMELADYFEHRTRQVSPPRIGKKRNRVLQEAA